jgi:hypothetical protein
MGAGGGEDGLRAAVTVAGLGHAAKVLERAVGEIAAQEHLHDRAGGLAGADSGCVIAARGKGKGAGVDQAACSDGEVAAYGLKVRVDAGRGGAAWAEQRVWDAAPGAAVAVGVGDTAAEVPAAGVGNVRGGQFGGVEGDGALVGARVEVDGIAALAAAAALARA